MKEKNSSHCFVRTDLELLVQLFRQFEDKGITDFRELENFLGKNQLANFDDLVQFITGPDCSDDKLVGHKQEELWALYIDNASHIIAEKKLFQGTLNRSVAHPREIFRWAVIYGCSGIFIAHNHPSGKLMPSSSDFELTEDLCQVAKMMKIDFLDHFIVGQGHYLSMREEKLV